MNNIQKINDIKYLIMEHYSDKETLNEDQKKSKQCVFRYCDDIKKELKALVVLKDSFDFDFALRFPSNQPMLKITNKRTNEYWEIPITKEEFDLLKDDYIRQIKEVLNNK